jgi:hypothetical protein
MAPSWREEYMQALHERDKREKASYERLDDKFIEACEHSPHSYPPNSDQI